MSQSETFSFNVPRLLHRAGVTRAFLSALAAPEISPAHEHAELRPDNPRLLNLKARYAVIAEDVVACSRWSPEYVSREVPLCAFRRDSAYVWQHRDYNLPISYALTYFFLRTQPKARRILDTCTEDADFGVWCMAVDGRVISRDLLDSANELAFIEEGIGRVSSVLDIGAGYGRLAHRISQAWPETSVTCVDAIPESTFLSEFYLRHRRVGDHVSVLPLDDIERLNGRAFDVAVNIHSFSECPGKAVAWWLRLAASLRIDWLFVIPNPTAVGAKYHITSTEPDGTRTNLVPVFDQCGYKLVSVSPKYSDGSLQQMGVTPTVYLVFHLMT